MTKHTPGRLSTSANIIRDANGIGAIADNPETASRLASCWNYCEGLDTEGMESALEIERPAKVFIDESTKKELELLAQRNELLDALIELRGACASAGWLTNPARIEHMDRACAAIAKATGAKA